jgi:hypothetical protein
MVMNDATTMATMSGVLQRSKCQKRAANDVTLPPSQKSPAEETGFSSGRGVENMQGDENMPPAVTRGGVLQSILEDSDDDDSVLFSGTILTQGQVIPPISTLSHLNYDITAKEGDKFEVFMTEADTPLVLRDIDASEWKKNDFLKDTFKKPSARLSKKRRVAGAKDKLVTTPLVFPQCLLLGAKTLKDRLVVVNWWLNQSKEQQQEASPLPLRLNARGSAIAEERGIAPKIVSILDNQQLKEAHVVTTASNATAYGARNAGWRKGAPATNSQVFDRKTRRQLECLMKHASKVMMDICPSNKISASVQIMLQIKVRAPEKSRHGGVAAGSAQMKDHHIVLAESEESIMEFLGSRGEQQARQLAQAPSTELWYRQDQKPLPRLKRGRNSSLCCPGALRGANTTETTTGATSGAAASMEESAEAWADEEADDEEQVDDDDDDDDDSL